jgi:hypothetical protein
MRALVLLAGLTASAPAFATACPGYDLDLGNQTGVSVASGNTCGRGNDVGGTCAGNAASEEATFLWTAPSTGNVAFATTGSNYDSALTIQDASTCAELACNDDGSLGLTSYIDLPVTAGVAYIVNVDGYNTSSCGNFELTIQANCADFDGDGVCDNVDTCVGDDTTGDDDYDGICNDTDFTLAAQISAGNIAMGVINAPPGATIYFLGGTSSGYTCSPAGSPCVEIRRPRVLGTAVANQAGVASFSIAAPAVMPPAIFLEAAYASPAPGNSTNTLVF